MGLVHEILLGRHSLAIEVSTRRQLQFRRTLQEDLLTLRGLLISCIRRSRSCPFRSKSCSSVSFSTADRL